MPLETKEDQTHQRDIEVLWRAMPTQEHAEIFKNVLHQAFLEGAKFWEWHKTGAAMWQSDQRLCQERAQEKYHAE